jgi:hypothetical protein
MRLSETIVGCLLLLVVLAGCKNSFQHKLAERIKQKCGTQPKAGCAINLKDVTTFKWDRMYLFGSWTTSDSIASKIGFKYDSDDTYDDTQRILFTDGNKVVFEEDIDYLNGDKEILFDTTDDTLFQSKSYYTSSEAIFDAIKNDDKEFAEYSLTHAKIRN